MTQAAALAFYTGLALAPLLTLLMWFMRFVTPDARERVMEAFAQVLGEEAAKPLAQVRVDQPSMNIAGLISLGILVFSATGVFGQLQSALNWMWDVKAAPTAGWFNYIRKRLLSLGMIMAILFLLLVSMVASAVVQAVVNAAGTIIPGGDWLLVLLNLVVSLVLFTGLFGLLFYYVPDVKVAWRDVWFGAALTAVLFTLGKWLLGWYLGRSSYESSYGAAAGSFIALLAWVYYSSIILFIGAEATQVYARRLGHEIEPDKHAVRIDGTTTATGTTA